MSAQRAAAGWAIHSPPARAATANGLLLLGITAILGTCFRALEARDPALMPQSVIVSGYGWRRAAEAYGAWPADAGLAHKVLYLVLRGPLLLAHVQQQWSFPEIPLVGMAVAAAVCGTWARGRGMTRIILTAWCLRALCMLASCALSIGASEPIACHEYRRSSWLHAPACSTAVHHYKYIYSLTNDWRIGVFATALLLPAGWAQVLGGLVMCLTIASVVPILGARYGIDLATGACSHAPVPLTWRRLVGALSRHQLLPQLLTALASSLAVPLVTSFAYGWLGLRKDGGQGPGRPARPSGAGSGCGSRVRRAASKDATSSKGCGGNGGSGCDGNSAGDGSTGGGAGGNSGSSQEAAGRDGDASCCAGHRSGGPNPAAPQAADVGGPADAPAELPINQEALAARLQPQGRLQQPNEAAAAPARAGDTCLYRSPVAGAQRLVLHCKLVGGVAGGEGAPAPLLAEQVPALLADVMEDVRQQAQAAGLKGAAALQLLQVCTFPGCIQVVAMLTAADAAQLLNAALQKGLRRVLPAGVQLRACRLAPGEPAACLAASPMAPAAAAAAAAAPAPGDSLPGEEMWCEPLAFPAALPGSAGSPQELTLHVPQQLLADLAMAGRGVRIVVSDGVTSAAVLDQRIAADDAAWPGDGVLRLQLPPCQGPLVLLHLLSTAPPGTAEHGLDELAGTAAALVLPNAAACAEVGRLFELMQREAGEEAAAQKLSAARGAAAAAHMRAFVMDYGQLLAAPPVQQAVQQVLVRHLQTFLAVHDMHSCLQLLWTAGVVVGARAGAASGSQTTGVARGVAAAAGIAAPAAAETNATSSTSSTGRRSIDSSAGPPSPKGACTSAASSATATTDAVAAAAGATPATGATHAPPTLTPRTLLLGFKPPAAEVDYELWKAQHLARTDLMFVALMGMHAMGGVVAFARGVVEGTSGSEAGLGQLQFGTSVMMRACTYLVPMWAYAFRPRLFRQQRGRLAAWSAFVFNLLMWVYAQAVLQHSPAAQDAMQAMLVPRAHVLLLLQLLMSWMQHPTVFQALQTAVGQAATVHTMVTMTPLAAWFGQGFVLTTALTVAMACWRDWHLRRRWLGGVGLLPLPVPGQAGHAPARASHSAPQLKAAGQ